MNKKLTKETIVTGYYCLLFLPRFPVEAQSGSAMREIQGFRTWDSPGCSGVLACGV